VLRKEAEGKCVGAKVRMCGSARIGGGESLVCCGFRVTGWATDFTDFEEDFTDSGECVLVAG